MTVPNKISRSHPAAGATDTPNPAAPEPTRDEQITWLCIQGKLTYEQIADQFGMTAAQLRALRKRLGLNLNPLERIAAFNRRHKGTTGRFASLIADAKNNSGGEASNRNAIAAGQSVSPFHEVTNAR